MLNVRVGLEITDLVGVVNDRLAEELIEREGRETVREALWRDTDDRETLDREETDLAADDLEADERDDTDRPADDRETRPRDWAWSQAAGIAINADNATINNSFAFMTHLHS
ncbi:MAG: hypothetical protein GY869_20980 [Planctomycetes bacterium]|nr:hypothetical protein [Planctomycetota bacterium]